MSVSVEQGSSFAVVRLRGELDASTAPTAEDAIDGASAVNGEVVLDLASVFFLDSVGLALLIAACTRGEVQVLRDVSAPVLRIMDRAGVTGLFELIRSG